MKYFLKLLSLFLLFIAISCGKQKDYSGFASGADEKNKTEELPKLAEPNYAIDRKVITEGEINFETSNPTITRELITKSITEFKGYIANDNIYDYKDKIEYRVTVRVPSNKFDLLLDRISKSVKKLDSKNINALDVTEEFIDIETRLKTKKALENRFKEILQKANKVNEILNIEKEIGNLRTEIEAQEGRLAYLKNKVSFSTLTIIYYKTTSTSFGFGSKIINAIKDGWSYLLILIISILSVWPILLLIFIFIILYKKINKKKVKQSNNP